MTQTELDVLLERVANHTEAERIGVAMDCMRMLPEVAARLKEWEDYWGCESPHDSHVQAGCYPNQLGKEQARANRAENTCRELLEALKEAVEYVGVHCHGSIDDTPVSWRAAIAKAEGRKAEGHGKNTQLSGEWESDMEQARRLR